MNADNTKDSREQERRMHAEMLDSIDEELEMEIDDDRMDALVAEATERAGEGRDLSRNFYFKALFRLQGELVKLQDWVVHKGLKVVVLFEGRDAAGKGGVIKRITQRLNPRVCHVVALPAPSSRAAGAKQSRAHAVVFPALRAASARRRGDRAVRP